MNLLPQGPSINTRYRQFQVYETSPSSIDAAFFASSRGGVFDLTLLAHLLGVHEVASFVLPAGLMTDHLPCLQFLLDDKAARGDHLRAVFVLLDADLFGGSPWTNSNIDAFLPSEVSYESRWRFWSRYLTVYQFKNWIATVTHALSIRQSKKSAQGEGASVNFGAIDYQGMQAPRLARPSAAVDTPIDRTDPHDARPDVNNQLGLLARFAVLCSENGVGLTVALSPLNRNNPEAASRDTDYAIRQIAGITPVWDFGRPQWLTDRPDLWLDNSHYSSTVAAMMMHRMFGGERIVPPDFGRLIVFPALEGPPI